VKAQPTQAGPLDHSVKASTEGRAIEIATSLADEDQVIVAD
jgi:hypothetical protein